MSKIKEILVLHHSHLDIGYTHPQKMLLELQCDYIDQAIDLCIKTKDYPEEARFRWTCEATLPLLKWLESATEDRKALLKNLIREGRISVAAFPFHVTPGCAAFQMTEYLQKLDQIRKITGAPVKTAISHDVNGQPWTLAPLLLDSKVEFYITGMNIHFGGIPFPRPYVFRWETPDGRYLPTFLGEHYSLFSQLFFTEEGSTKRLHEGIEKYIARIEKSSWDQDFVYLTSTNPPLLDNNSPDWYLADLIRDYNAEGHEQKIRFVTPEMLWEKVKQMEEIPVERGDWTDYWNFGSASTAREQKISRRAKTLLQKSDFMECINPEKSLPRFQKLREKAYEKALLYDEHTWGAWECTTDPENEETYAQLIHKEELAYDAADLAAYLVGYQAERYSKNPAQGDVSEGIMLVNPTGETIRHPLYKMADFKEKGRTLSANRIRNFLPYDRETDNRTYMGSVEIPPFTVQKMPVDRLWNQKESEDFKVEKNEIETPFYLVSLHPKTGHIQQITDKKTGRKMVDETGEWRFFDLVEEHVDPRYADPVRRAMFDKDVEKVNTNVTQWQHQWKALRKGITDRKGSEIRKCKDTLEILTRGNTDGMKNICQKVTFSSVSPVIGLDVSFDKKQVLEPDGVYLVFPLALEEGWSCVYDTAETFVKLDEQQLGHVCRDYFTVDKTVSMFDKKGGYTLACPDAPMIQAGDFNFGRELHEIPRKKNPLLLAWPLNNYWDTNFPASQQGRMSFHYELSCFTEFDEKQAYKAGIQAQRPCMESVLVNCKETEEKQLLSYTGKNSKVLFLQPRFEENGWLVTIKNYGSKKEKVSLEIKDRIIENAAITDLPGNVKREVRFKEHTAEFETVAEEITFLSISFRE